VKNKLQMTIFLVALKTQLLLMQLLMMLLLW